MKHGFNIVGRVRELTFRYQHAETSEERARASNALIAIHEILKGEGLEGYGS